MIKIAFTFAFERICFMKFVFDECKFFLALSHPYIRYNTIQHVNLSMCIVL